MPTLHWIGKEAVVNHHHTVPFHLLREVPELSVGAPGSGNLIVQGDNLVALKALLPYYAGQVKCIYIDPPYNTGNEGWVYNDNVNSPLIREWLGNTVGEEAEDLCRHDKWLCMMYPRLALLRQFLREDGAIFISIDEVEISSLLQIMDEIFGFECRLALFSWVRKKKGSNLSKEFRKVTEYIAAYKRTSAKIELRGVPAYAEKMVPLLNRANPESTLRFAPGMLKVGRAFSDGFVRAGVKGADKGELAVVLENDIRVENGVIATACRIRGRWRWSQATVDEELRNGSQFVVSKDFRINVARYNQSEKFKAPESLLTPDDGIGTNEDATEELRTLFSELPALPFAFPKPTSLVRFLLQAASNPGDLVLDSFAGSGTTGHAVLQLNKQDGGNRRFILVEMEPRIARKVTAERVKRVALGYTNAKGEQVPGLGGGFRFCELGTPLFDERGQIRPDVTFADLARHVYFTETGEPLPGGRAARPPLLDVCRGVAVYLLFNGVLGDRSAGGGNVLTRAMLARLPRHEGPKVVYAAGCLLGRERLRAERITFRQTPYEIKVA